jgi:hypothetical protein
MGLNGIVPPGVVTGDNLLKLMEYCKKHSVALPGGRKPFMLHNHVCFQYNTLSSILVVMSTYWCNVCCMLKPASCHLTFAPNQSCKDFSLAGNLAEF